MGWALSVAAMAALIAQANPGSNSAAGTKSNVKGPSVEQIHAAPLKFDSEQAAYNGKKPGPIVRPATRVQFEYELPDGSKILFGRCGVEHRCDFVLLQAEVGEGGEAEVADANSTIGAMDTLYGRDVEQGEAIRALSMDDRPGKVVLVQRLVLDDSWKAETIHARYVPTFSSYAAELRKRLKSR